MKTISSKHIAFATLGGLMAFTLPAIGQSPSDQPINQDNPNKNPHLAPAPAVTVQEVTTPATYNPDQPQDRTNKPASAVDPKLNPSVTPLSSPDARFVKKAALCGDSEIVLSQQASAQSGNAQVRTFAQSLVTDHERSNRELALIAQRGGVVLPVNDKEAAKEADKLAKKTGKDYDEHYLDAVIDQHEDAIDLYEKASKSQNTDIAAFAVNQLPTLRDHLARAKQLEKAVD